MVSQAERRAATIAAILASAQKQFATKGFEATTIDEIAARASLAKGAVYHHFGSKEEIFERVLDSILADMAQEVRRAAAPAKDLVDSAVLGTQRYLECATAPRVRRILLVDGPAVLGWNKWREMDKRHFGTPTETLKAQASASRMTAAEIEAISHLVAGAVMEAAFVCAEAPDPKKTARELAQALRLLLSGLPPFRRK